MEVINNSAYLVSICSNRFLPLLSNEHMEVGARAEWHYDSNLCV